MKNNFKKNTVKSLMLAGVGATLFAGVSTAPAQAVPESTWDALAQCESGGDWNINTGNGFYGGVQFTQSSWNAAGGSGSPQNASKAEQIRVAENLLSMQGWGAWPACSASLGLSGVPNDAKVTTQSTTVKVESTETKASAPVSEVQVVKAKDVPAENAKKEKKNLPTVSAGSPVETKTKDGNRVIEHVVVKGDTLSQVALDNGVQDWRLVAEANKEAIPNPDVIEVGDIIKIVSPQ